MDQENVCGWRIHPQSVNIMDHSAERRSAPIRATEGPVAEPLSQCDRNSLGAGSGASANLGELKGLAILEMTGFRRPWPNNVPY
jgi:hypothetical protein